MEKIPDPRNNIDHAWEAAHGEKPLRDIAREGWVDEDQKKTLDALAEVRGEETLKEYLSKESTETKKGTEKGLEEQEAIKKIIEIIKRSPEIQFVVAGIGNILDQKERPPTDGRRSGYFDHQSQKMMEGNKFDFLDNNPRGVLYKEQLFTTQWDLIEEGNGVVLVAARIPFRVGSEVKNSYVTENRTGTFVTLALRFNQDTLSLQDKEIEKRLKEPTTEFYGQLLGNCAKEFVPGYWNFVLDLRRKYNERNK